MIVLKQTGRFRDKPSEPAYPREMLLKRVLMSVFDGELSSRKIKRRTRTDIDYMYLTGRQKPVYRTILRFKWDYSDLIDEAFKTTLKIAKEKIRSKTAELPFAHIKQNMRLTEFTRTGLKQLNTEFKLYTLGHNLKRIYNEINNKNN